MSNKVDNQAEEISGDDCNDINTLSLYRVHSRTENAFQAGEGGLLLSLPWDINRQQQIAANPLGTTLAHRCKNGGIWGSWMPIANATPPQEYDLSLADGITSYGVTRYCKTQERIVIVNFAIEFPIVKGGSGSYLFATLPAGFRPIGELHTTVNAWCDDPEVRSPIECIVQTTGEMYAVTTLQTIKTVYGQVVFVAD